MKAGIYSPYWDTLGGGEYYAGMVAKILEDKGFQVEIFSPDPATIKHLNQRFQIGLTQSKVNPSGAGFFQKNLLAKWYFTRQYDVIFFVSDGSLPFLFGKLNLVHFQVPFRRVSGRNWLNRLKLKNIHHLICNSQFTKSHIDSEFGTDSLVIYPSVKPIPRIGKKNRLILSVGRFDGGETGKRQDVLIESFKQFNAKGWQLVLAGGALNPNHSYLSRLKKQAHGWPIIIDVNCSYDKLKAYYQSAAIYWHAHGYQTDLLNSPANSEHFGISVVEAMSAGAVPIVFNGGGLTEIVDAQTGFTWNTPEELIAATKQATIKAKDPQFINRIVFKSHRFSKGVFDAKFQKILG